VFGACFLSNFGDEFVVSVLEYDFDEEPPREPGAEEHPGGGQYDDSGGGGEDGQRPPRPPPRTPHITVHTHTDDGTIIVSSCPCASIFRKEAQAK